VTLWLSIGVFALGLVTLVQGIALRHALARNRNQEILLARQDEKVRRDCTTHLQYVAGLERVQDKTITDLRRDVLKLKDELAAAGTERKWGNIPEVIAENNRLIGRLGVLSVEIEDLRARVQDEGGDLPRRSTPAEREEDCTFLFGEGPYETKAFFVSPEDFKAVYDRLLVKKPWHLPPDQITDFDHVTHEGRILVESDDPGYCGSTDLAGHMRQVRDRESWVRHCLDRWLKLGLQERFRKNPEESLGLCNPIPGDVKEDGPEETPLAEKLAFDAMDHRSDAEVYKAALDNPSEENLSEWGKRTREYHEEGEQKRHRSTTFGVMADQMAAGRTASVDLRPPEGSRGRPHRLEAKDNGLWVWIPKAGFNLTVLAKGSVLLRVIECWEDLRGQKWNRHAGGPLKVDDGAEFTPPKGGG
jgi:hypothetical protein